MSETGSEYIRKVLPEINLSPLAADVADFLADWYGGMHNFVHQTNIKKINWENDFWIEVPFRRGISTYDDSYLTRLVVMSHDRCLRVEINPRHRDYIEFVFHRRSRNSSDISKRMPTMEDHLLSIRGAA